MDEPKESTKTTSNGGKNMLDELKKEANLKYTENGALTYRSTYSSCLDLFATCGAMRQADSHTIIRKFTLAYTESPDIAMRILFYARDIRGGLGERRFFTIILHNLANTAPQSVKKNLPLIGEYGRYDDILSLLGTKCENAMAGFIAEQLKKDIYAMENEKSVSLLAKWLPSVNSSVYETSERAKKLCRLLGMREKEYRKTLSALRSYIGIVEDKMRRKDYTFNYEKLSGKALFKYRRAMYRHDKKRYKLYIKNVHENKVEMNTQTIYPYDIVRTAMHTYDPDMASTLDATWKSLPNYADSRNALAVIDVSLSMYESKHSFIEPITAALSLGIYFAEHSTGHFANHFITFSKEPQLIDLGNTDIVGKVKRCLSYCEAANTDVFSVFVLILATAIKNKLPQSELPETIYLISDMEFDRAVSCDKTVFEVAKKAFEEYGYTLPRIVFWNVAARNDNFPITFKENGAALVSGSSPVLFSQILSQNLTPVNLMEQVIGSERYRSICA